MLDVVCALVYFTSWGTPSSAALNRRLQDLQVNNRDMSLFLLINCRLPAINVMNHLLDVTGANEHKQGKVGAVHNFLI